MNKNLMHIFLCTTCILFSIMPKGLSQHASQAAQSPTDAVADIFENINRTFADTALFDPFRGYGQRDPALEAKSLNETLKKIESEALYMQQEARRLRNSLYGKALKKDTLVHETKDLKKKLQKTTDTVSDLLVDMEDNLAEVIERSNYQVKEYETEEYESGDATTYGIKISLPGFKEEDVKVTISTDNKNGKTLHRLEVTGTKKITAATEEEKDVNGKKVTLKKASSQAFTSSKFVNGRQTAIDYKDGHIKVKFDLPGDIDTREGKYTMSFEKETLKLEFPRQTKTTTKVPLKYTNTNPK